MQGRQLSRVEPFLLSHRLRQESEHVASETLSETRLVLCTQGLSQILGVALGMNVVSASVVDDIPLWEFPKIRGPM